MPNRDTPNKYANAPANDATRTKKAKKKANERANEDKRTAAPRTSDRTTPERKNKKANGPERSTFIVHFYFPDEGRHETQTEKQKG
jgi:hypothetical protein